MGGMVARSHPVETRLNIGPRYLLPPPGEGRALAPRGAALPAPVEPPQPPGPVAPRAEPEPRRARRAEAAEADASPADRAGPDGRRAADRIPPAASAGGPAAPGARGASAPFLAQVLAQEAIGPGLHIEPWREAMAAYARAASAGGRPAA